MKNVLKVLLACLAAVAVLIVLPIVILSIFVANISGDVTLEHKNGTALEINLSELIVDEPALFDPSVILSSYVTPKVSLLDAIMAIEMAAEDENIKAISIVVDGRGSISLAHAYELLLELENFKTNSGKPIFAYGENMSQTEYMFACAAEEIYLHPLGNIEWKGVATYSPYFKDLFDSIGVSAEAFRPAACVYKSAIEPFTLSEMSPRSKAQSQRLVDGLWQNILQSVSSMRGLSLERLRELSKEQVILSSEQAISDKMIDHIAYYDEYEKRLQSEGVLRESYGALERGGMRTLTLSEYVGFLERNTVSRSSTDGTVAIIYIDGEIVSGESDGANGLAGSQTIVERLREASDRAEVKSVVLRVNSPGGSAMAADVIWREVENLRERKPVVVSFGEMAASGGYYVSCSADFIVTTPYTLTGSIGVYGLLMAAEKGLKNHLKIAFDGVGTSPSASFGILPREVNEVERAAMMRGVGQVYESFTRCVSEGRNLSMSEVEKVAGGAVWTGVEATQNGLADSSGGLKLAVAYAAERAGLKAGEYDLEEFVDEPTGLDLLLGSIFVKAGSILGSYSPLHGFVSEWGGEIESGIRSVERSARGEAMLLDHLRLKN